MSDLWIAFDSFGTLWVAPLKPGKRQSLLMLSERVDGVREAIARGAKYVVQVDSISNFSNPRTLYNHEKGLTVDK